MAIGMRLSDTGADRSGARTESVRPEMVWRSSQMLREPSGSGPCIDLDVSSEEADLTDALCAMVAEAERRDASDVDAALLTSGHMGEELILTTQTDRFCVNGQEVVIETTGLDWVETMEEAIRATGESFEYRTSEVMLADSSWDIGTTRGRSFNVKALD